MSNTKYTIKETWIKNGVWYMKISNGKVFKEIELR